MSGPATTFGISGVALELDIIEDAIGYSGPGVLRLAPEQAADLIAHIGARHADDSIASLALAEVYRNAATFGRGGPPLLGCEVWIVADTQTINGGCDRMGLLVPLVGEPVGIVSRARPHASPPDIAERWLAPRSEPRDPVWSGDDLDDREGP